MMFCHGTIWWLSASHSYELGVKDITDTQVYLLPCNRQRKTIKNKILRQTWWLYFPICKSSSHSSVAIFHNSYVIQWLVPSTTIYLKIKVYVNHDFSASWLLLHQGFLVVMLKSWLDWLLRNISVTNDHGYVLIV